VKHVLRNKWVRGVLFASALSATASILVPQDPCSWQWVRDSWFAQLYFNCGAGGVGGGSSGAGD
jgi:hypothetical protein